MSAGAGAHGGWLRRVKLTEVAGRGRTCRRAPNPRPSPRSLRSFRLSPSGCNHMQSHAIPAASIESLPLPKSHTSPPGVDLCHCRSNLARAQFRATASVMGTTPPHAHLPERRACSCKGPKKPHRNLVGLRRTASRSPRSVLSARAPPRSFITAIGVCRRDFTA